MFDADGVCMNYGEQLFSIFPGYSTVAIELKNQTNCDEIYSQTLTIDLNSCAGDLACIVSKINTELNSIDAPDGIDNFKALTATDFVCVNGNGANCTLQGRLSYRVGKPYLSCQLPTCVGEAWRTYMMQTTSWEDFADVDLSPLPLSANEGVIVGGKINNYFLHGTCDTCGTIDDCADE